MTPALVAVSHGTSSADGQAAVAGLVDAVRLRLPGVDVLDAYVDVQKPALEDVLDRLGEPAVVLPLLLAPGFHFHVDVARAVSRRAATTAAVLGPDRSVTGVLVDRLASVGLCDDDVLVLGVAGSRDFRAHRSVDSAATRLAIALGREVRVGHLGGTGRPIRDVVAEAATSRSRIVVATYLLAPGYFANVLSTCGADAVTAPLLSGGLPDPRLVQLVVDRFQRSAAQWRYERAS